MADDYAKLLDELEALEKKATQPPWWVPAANVGRVLAGDEKEKTLLLVVNDDHEDTYFGRTPVSYRDSVGYAEAGHREAADRRFIAAARNALPLLIRLARRGLAAGEVERAAARAYYRLEHLADESVVTAEVANGLKAALSRLAAKDGA